MDKVSQGGS